MQILYGSAMLCIIILLAFSIAIKPYTVADPKFWEGARGTVRYEEDPHSQHEEFSS